MQQIKIRVFGISDKGWASWLEKFFVNNHDKQDKAKTVDMAHLELAYRLGKEGQVRKNLRTTIAIEDMMIRKW
jgi:hypothetical protein